MADKFVSWLEHVGAAARKDLQIALNKVLPVAAEVAAEAEPVVDLALPMVGPTYNRVVAAVIATEKAYALSGQQNGTGTQKMQGVLAAVSSSLLPGLEDAGVTGDAATAAMTNYIQSIVNLLNGPAIAAAVNKAAGTPQAVPAA